MKGMFSGYYDPIESELKSLWSKALIVLDTNALLNLYRLNKTSRDQVQALMLSVESQLWIPYQVAVEFQRNRRAVLKGEHDSAKAVATSIGSEFNSFRKAIGALKLEEKGCSKEASATMDLFQKEVDKLRGTVNDAVGGYLAPNDDDSILSFWTGLLDGKVGERPASQALVDQWNAEAAERYLLRQGPGFLDQDKAGDKYVSDGLIYERQYGDYILWAQMLDYAAQYKHKQVILVTSDQKEDWWLDTKSSSGLRPQPELCMEAKRVAGIDMLWMYSLPDFVKAAKKYLRSAVSAQTIHDVELADRFMRDAELKSFHQAHVHSWMALSNAGKKGLAFAVDPYTAIAKVLRADSLEFGKDGIPTATRSPRQGSKEGAFKYALVDLTDCVAPIADFTTIPVLQSVVELLDEVDAVLIFTTKRNVDQWIGSWAYALGGYLSSQVRDFISVIAASYIDGKVAVRPILEEMATNPLHLQ